MTFHFQVSASGTSFQIEYRTTISEFKKPSASISRSVSQLKWLHGELQSACTDCVVPPLMENIKDSKGEDLKESDCSAVADFLTRLGAHPVISRSSVFREFLEGSGLDLPTSKSSHHGSGNKKGFLARVAQTVVRTGSGSTPGSGREIDPWFDHTRADTQSICNQFTAAHKHMERVSKARRHLATAMLDTAARYQDLGNEEPNIQLAGQLKKFAVVLEKVAGGLNGQAEQGASQLGAFLLYQIHYCQAMHDTMDARMRALLDYDDACKSTLKRKQNSDKLKMATAAAAAGTGSGSLRADKVDASLSDLAEARTRESDAKDLLRTMSEAIREREVPLFQKQRETGTVDALKVYARAQMELEARQKKEWEAILGEWAEGGVNGVAKHLGHHQLAEKIEAEVL